MKIGKFRIRLLFDWQNCFDWMLIPTLMIGFRKDEFSYRLGEFVTGFGIGVLFLKLKLQLTITTNGTN